MTIINLTCKQRTDFSVAVCWIPTNYTLPGISSSSDTIIVKQHHWSQITGRYAKRIRENVGDHFLFLLITDFDVILWASWSNKNLWLVVIKSNFTSILEPLPFFFLFFNDTLVILRFFTLNLSQFIISIILFLDSIYKCRDIYKKFSYAFDQIRNIFPFHVVSFFSFFFFLILDSRQKFNLVRFYFSSIDWNPNTKPLVPMMSLTLFPDKWIVCLSNSSRLSTKALSTNSCSTKIGSAALSNALNIV